MIIIGAAAKHTMQKNKLTSISLDVKKPEPEPIKPRIVPKMPPPPPIAKVEPPKIKLPDVKLPGSAQDVRGQDDPARPGHYAGTAETGQPPPAPQIVNLAHAMPLPSPTTMRTLRPSVSVTLRSRPSTVQPTTPINLGGGMHDMSASNTGSGPAATRQPRLRPGRQPEHERPR